MSIRYIYNTKGYYVAFIYNNNLFTGDCKWLGIVQEDYKVFGKDGYFIGHVTNDDRIAKDKNNFKKLMIGRPPRPPRPMRPLKRLSMVKLPHPYVDFFQDISSLKLTIRKDKFDFLLDSKLIANDGTFLGIVSKNRYDKKSISNPYGDYGSKYSEKSIFNKYGKYGSKYQALSPFSRYTNTPPKFQKDEEILGYLTAAKYTRNKIDILEFLAWLEI